MDSPLKRLLRLIIMESDGQVRRLTAYDTELDILSTAITGDPCFAVSSPGPFDSLARLLGHLDSLRSYKNKQRNQGAWQVLIRWCVKVKNGD